MSRGKFHRRDIRDVEKQLLKVVGWEVNPPTAHTFARELVCFIEDTDVREELMGDVLVVLDQTMKGKLRWYSFMILVRLTECFRPYLCQIFAIDCSAFGHHGRKHA